MYAIVQTVFVFLANLSSLSRIAESLFWSYVLARMSRATEENDITSAYL